MWRILAYEVLELLPALVERCLCFVSHCVAQDAALGMSLTPWTTKAYSSTRAFELLLRGISRGAIV